MEEVASTGDRRLVVAFDRVIGSENRVSPLALDEEFDVQRIFFGTDRAQDGSDDKGPSFGADWANALTLGHTDITIPKDAHRLGRVERPKNLRILRVILWQQKEDPRKHFTVQETALHDEATFLEFAGAEAQAAEAYANTAFVFVHGFNTTFGSAVFRAAQLAHDLGFDGPAFAYSWPSIGETEDYLRDVDSAENATPYMDAFLDLVFQTPGVEKVHLVAHSMGNAALAELLTRSGTRLSTRGKAIEQLVLAAPDLDAAKFDNIASYFTDAARSVTLYACASDRALLASQAIRGGFIRLGDVGADGPKIVPDVDSIDITAVGSDLFSLNHSTYAENRTLLDDLGALLLTGDRPPPRRMPTIK
ncbi:MAG: alpha/beta fold hydrolase [Rhodobacter sp.]|nr:alpha/beta fold hydrolase [Rhodobacter sp.]